MENLQLGTGNNIRRLRIKRF